MLAGKSIEAGIEGVEGFGQITMRESCGVGLAPSMKVEQVGLADLNQPDRRAKQNRNQEEQQPERSQLLHTQSHTLAARVESTNRPIPGRL